jgi:hypothetical protein
MDRDPIVAVADDPEFTRTKVQAQVAAGREVDREWVALEVFDREFGARQARRYQQGERREQGKVETPH